MECFLGLIQYVYCFRILYGNNHLQLIFFECQGQGSLIIGHAGLQRDISPFIIHHYD